MSEVMGLKAKLGLDVFKPDTEPHIRIKPGMEKDPRLKKEFGRLMRRENRN
jgi:ferredoxin like protein